MKSSESGNPAVHEDRDDLHYDMVLKGYKQKR
jgi:hypothetical protein